MDGEDGRFAGQVALVTGAATGIGAATANALGRQGAAVAVNHHGQPGPAQAVVAGIVDAGGTAVAVDADVSREESVADLVAKVTAELGPPDVLVNTAGVISRAPLVELTSAEWDRVLGVNLRGVYLCCRYVAARMIPAGGGRIINVSSDLAYVGEAMLAHYCAAKGGVLSLTRALARELIPYGIRVNAVAPGMTETPMLMANPVAYNPQRLSSIPAGRWGRPDEIAASICFLASTDADYYVGSVLSPNGGIVM